MVREGRIAAIEQAGAYPHPGVARVDGAGCTLMPGLTDAHGEPLEDVALFADPDNVRLVLGGGEVMKDTDGRLTA